MTNQSSTGGKPHKTTGGTDLSNTRTTHVYTPDLGWIDDILETIWMLGVEHQTFTMPVMEEKLDEAKSAIATKLQTVELEARNAGRREGIEATLENAKFYMSDKQLENMLLRVSAQLSKEATND